jgi:cyclohexyl-isocyanide hydratase
MTTHIGLLLYPRLTQLDLTGPFELFQRVPDARVHLLWKDAGPVHSDSGLGPLADDDARGGAAARRRVRSGGDGRCAS